jgi:hypothetical protein
MDDDLRELERRWQASRTPEDAERYQAALVRAGTLAPGEPFVVSVHGSLARRIVWTEFLEVATALLTELGDPLGPSTDEVVQLPHPTQFTSSATETRRSDGRRTLALERIEDEHFPGSMDSQDRSSAGRIEGLPEGTRLEWSSSGAGDTLTVYAIRGPATLVGAIDRAWSTVCERHAIARDERDRAKQAKQAASLAKGQATIRARETRKQEKRKRSR